MAKSEKRIQARQLRKKGQSIKFIARQLDVSKSTVSVWCGDLVLTQTQKDLLIKNAIDAGCKGRMVGAEMNRRKKQDRIDYNKRLGIEEIGRLTKRDLLLAGIGLYWGEGTKKSATALVNSDPNLILFMLRWFRSVMGVRDEMFRPQVFISDIHRPRAQKILAFWSKLLGLPKSQFGNIVFLKRKNKKIYENHDSYYGVMALRVRRGTELKYHILGLIEALSNSKKD